MPHALTDGKSTLVQLMACCLMTSSHYLNQCWPRSMSPYVTSKPQWVKRELMALVRNRNLVRWYTIPWFNSASALLHSLNLVTVGLSVGYETWPMIGWCYWLSDWSILIWITIWHWILHKKTTGSLLYIPNVMLLFSCNRGCARTLWKGLNSPLKSWLQGKYEINELLQENVGE